MSDATLDTLIHRLILGAVALFAAAILILAGTTLSGCATLSPTAAATAADVAAAQFRAACKQVQDPDRQAACLAAVELAHQHCRAGHGRESVDGGSEGVTNVD